MVKSLYIFFPKAGEVQVGEEEIGAPGPGEILCKACSNCSDLQSRVAKTG
jgi:hypothetical protein